MKRSKEILQKNYLNQGDSYTIGKDSPYYVEESYFIELMIELGVYIADKYEHGTETGVDELLSRIAYHKDLTIQQKMSLALFLGKHLQNKEYEKFILACMNQMPD